MSNHTVKYHPPDNSVVERAAHQRAHRLHAPSITGRENLEAVGWSCCSNEPQTTLRAGVSRPTPTRSGSSWSEARKCNSEFRRPRAFLTWTFPEGSRLSGRILRPEPGKLPDLEQPGSHGLRNRCLSERHPDFTSGSERTRRACPSIVESTQWLKINEAAAVSGVSSDTIRRNLKAGAFPRSRRALGLDGSETGAWLIPVADLVAAGLRTDQAVMRTAAGEIVTPGPTAYSDSTTNKLAVLLLWSWTLERRRACDLEAENTRLWKVLHDIMRCGATLSADGEGVSGGQD